MPLTMREILELDPLGRGRLVAGAKGLDNEVRWVTIVEVLEDVGRLEPGELLVTTAYQLSEEPSRQREYVEGLAERGLAGLAVITGFYVDEIPAGMREAADEARLPLIDLPPTINFSDITHAVLERLVNRQYELLHASEQVHSELTRLALEDAELAELVEVMGRWTTGEVVLWNASGQPVEGSPGDAVQEVLAGLIETSPAGHPSEGVPLPTLRFLLDDGECLVVPVRAGPNLYGYVTLTHRGGRIRELEAVALGHAATVAALLLSRKEAVNAETARLQGEFMDAVLQAGERDRSGVIARAADFGCRLDRPHAALILGGGCGSESPSQGESPGQRWNGGRARITSLASDVLCSRVEGFLLRPRKDQLVILAEVTSAEEAEAVGEALLSLADSLGEPLRVGVGTVAHDLADFEQSVREAEVAYRLGPLAGFEQGVVPYERLGLFRTAVELEQKGVSLDELCRTSLGGLVADDQRIRRLRETVDAFFRNHGNLQATADSLYVHRHTLRYRLKRVESITGRDLKDPMDRLSLHFGTVLFRYLEATNDRI